MASGPEHFRESQRLIGEASRGATIDISDVVAALLAVAHATLAQTAAIAESVPADRAKAWSKVTGR